MRTVEPEQAEFAKLITKQHQIFAEHFNRLRDIVEIVRNTDNHPIAPKPFAAWRTRPDVGNIRYRCGPEFFATAYFCHYLFLSIRPKRLERLELWNVLNDYCLFETIFLPALQNRSTHLLRGLCHFAAEIFFDRQIEHQF